MGDARRTGHNLIIIDDNGKSMDGKWGYLSWRCYKSTFGNEQSFCNSVTKLVNVCLNKIKEQRNKNKNITLGSTIAPTFNAKGFLQGTSYAVPLNATELNSQITIYTINQLIQLKKGTMQFFGLNGIEKNDPCVGYVWSMNERCLLSKLKKDKQLT